MARKSDDSNKFHGNPCINCGGTLRYKVRHDCVACKIKAGKKSEVKKKKEVLENRAGRRSISQSLLWQLRMMSKWPTPKI